MYSRILNAVLRLGMIMMLVHLLAIRCARRRCILPYVLDFGLGFLWHAWLFERGLRGGVVDDVGWCRLFFALFFFVRRCLRFAARLLGRSHAAHAPAMITARAQRLER